MQISLDFGNAPIKTQKCSKCNIKKPLEAYGFKKDGSGRLKTCKECLAYNHEKENSWGAGVYGIWHRIWKKYLYIGQSKILYRRNKEHLSEYKTKKGHQHKSSLSKAIAAGEINRGDLEFRILYKSNDLNERKEKEWDLIVEHQPKYNKRK